MLAHEIAEAAEQFLSKIALADDRFKPTGGYLVADAGRFCDIFRKTYKPEAGAYWFFRPDGVVFDIGKSENSVWKRNCDHAGGPRWIGDPSADFKDTTGDGWGFTASSHLKYNIDKTSGSTRVSIENGTFHVGWMSVDPPYFAPLLEVYLQTLYLSVADKLPELCYRTG